MNCNEFWGWADAERHKRELSWSAIERRAGASNALVSRRATAHAAPTPAVADALARAFHLPVEYVYERAGLEPPVPPIDWGDPRVQEVAVLFPRPIVE